MHLIYTSPTPLTVCSGLDDVCYTNNNVIDIGINFESYNHVCHTIYLTVRVNPRSRLELILGRDTLNKYNFFALTPSAFGVPPEIAAQRQKYKDHINNNFKIMAEKNKLNPIYASKYAQPMSSDEPSSDVVEELIQPIPTTTKSNKKKNSANKAKNKAKLAAAITVLRDIEQPALASKPTHVCCHSCNDSRSGSCPAQMELATPIAGCDEGRMILGGIITPISGRTGDTQPQGDDTILTPSDPGSSFDEEHNTSSYMPSGVVISNDEIDSDKTDTFGPFLRNGGLNVPP